MCYPIVSVTKTGEAITMEALTDHTYEKCYFPVYEIGKPLENPRKIKIVECINVEEYFDHMIETEGYIPIPQDVCVSAVS